MNGALADLKQWVMDTGEPELEAEFRKLLGLRKVRISRSFLPKLTR